MVDCPGTHGWPYHLAPIDDPLIIPNAGGGADGEKRHQTSGGLTSFPTRGITMPGLVSLFFCVQQTAQHSRRAMLFDSRSNKAPAFAQNIYLDYQAGGFAETNSLADLSHAAAKVVVAILDGIPAAKIITPDGPLGERIQEVMKRGPGDHEGGRSALRAVWSEGTTPQPTRTTVVSPRL